MNMTSTTFPEKLIDRQRIGLAILGELWRSSMVPSRCRRDAKTILIPAAHQTFLLTLVHPLSSYYDWSRERFGTSIPSSAQAQNIIILTQMSTE